MLNFMRNYSVVIAGLTRNLLNSCFLKLRVKSAILPLILILLILSASCYVTAQTDPFALIEMSAETELFDSTENQGANNQPIQYVEGFGIGYSYIGDCVILRDLDFTKKSAKAISVLMANGDDETLNLSVHINNPDSEPIAVINVTPTDGYTREKAKLFSADFDAPVEGTATVYIKWLNKTGNMFGVEFFDESLEKEGIEKEERANKSDFPPPTGDNIYVFAAMTVAAAFAGARVYGKAKIKK